MKSKKKKKPQKTATGSWCNRHACQNCRLCLWREGLMPKLSAAFMMWRTHAKIVGRVHDVKDSCQNCRPRLWCEGLRPQLSAAFMTWKTHAKIVGRICDVKDSCQNCRPCSWREGFLPKLSAAFMKWRTQITCKKWHLSQPRVHNRLNRQSDEHWNRFKSNAAETSERRLERIWAFPSTWIPSWTETVHNFQTLICKRPL